MKINLSVAAFVRTWSLSILTIAALHVLTNAATAQQFQPVTLLNGGTQFITAGSTSNYTAVVNVRGAEKVGILTGTKLINTGTEDIVFKFSKSMDGSTFETTPSILITNVCTGATAVNQITVVDVSGVHTLKLATIISASARDTTNVTVRVGVKNFSK